MKFWGNDCAQFDGSKGVLGSFFSVANKPFAQWKSFVNPDGVKKTTFSMVFPRLCTCGDRASPSKGVPCVLHSFH